MAEKKLTIVMQLGKNGLSDNFLMNLKNSFKDRENIRVTILKSAAEERKRIKELTGEILEKLGKNYTARVIGFTIVLKKWRKPVRD
jgi:RNA-binding protein YhbY